MSSTRLPVASGPQVRSYAGSLLRRHPCALAGSLSLYALAAVAGLAGPRLLGDLVEAVRNGTTRTHVDTLVLLLCGFVLLQTLLTRFARLSSSVLGERIFAELREEFLGRVVALPISTVERAGSGDLLTRMNGDIEALSRSVRFGVPETLVAAVTTSLTVVAMFWVAPLVALPALVVVPLLFVSTRWYLRRAPRGYQRERAAYSTLTASFTETVEGGRTVEALRREELRVRRTHDDIRRAWVAERYTLRLRTVWFPAVESAYVVPVVAVLIVGGLLHIHGLATLGQVTAVTLYVQQLIDPMDRLISWLDELQIGGASLARLVGVAHVPPDPSPSGALPEDNQLDVDDVHFAYTQGRDVLHGIDLEVVPGERLAMVGPSGAGKSTLGRLLAGIHAPRHGRVTLGGVDLTDLELEQLRQEVALVTQEHHIFVGTVADNLLLARPDASREDLREALQAVDALEWVEALPDGLDTAVGSGALALSPAQAQQIALARLVLIDPHTLVLDEATSLLDPRAARHLERSLAAVLDGRTVIAIAHRLHTAHDADRVAVVEDGRITELGSHHELLDAAGSYAALWRSWQADGGT
jgi:ABC-type multidrug transport system fused ATPase/permease subunit